MNRYEREGAKAFRSNQSRESCRYKKPDCRGSWLRGFDGEADRKARADLFGASGDMLHVKTVGGELVPSGDPSCWQCSRAILADKRIDGVWLFHADGWRRYNPIEFHEATLRARGLPVLRGDHGV
jgi:ribosome modulation factor